MKIKELDDIVIKDLLAQNDLKGIRAAFKDMETADISEIYEDLDIRHCIVLFRLIPKERRAEVFSHIHFELQEELLSHLPDVVGITILNEMDPVDRTRLLEELPQEISTRFILKLNPEERKMAWQLLSYPEDSIGRIMTPEFASVHSGITVRDALADIRWNSTRIPEPLLHNIFVIGGEGELLGHVSLASLVIADPASIPVDELMDRTIDTLSVYEGESSAVDYFRKYDRPYIPVVDEDGKLVGLVEADDIFDVAEEEATEDIQAFGGSASLEDSYFQTSLFVLFQKRSGWLAFIFIMMMFSANVLEHYEAFIQTMSFLIIFLPLIISQGGNSGSQAASLIIRGMAVRELELNDWWKVLKREAVLGFCLGIVLGTLGYLRATVFSHLDFEHGMIISLSLVGVVAFGNIAGSMLPFLLKACRLDPAVSSSPVIAALMDLVGITLLFNIATSLTNYFKTGQLF